jgi:hypothetical protein
MRKDMGAEEEVPARVVMAGAEEPELSDDELLGAATLAKISARLPVVEYEEEETEADEIGASDEADVEADEDIEAIGAGEVVEEDVVSEEEAEGQDEA